MKLKMYYLPFMIMMFVACCGKNTATTKPLPFKPVEICVNGKAIKCPCGCNPEHIYIMRDNVEARCTACLHGEFIYSMADLEYPFEEEDDALLESIANETTIP